MPADKAAQLDHGRGDFGGGEHVGGLAVGDSTIKVHFDDPVGVLDDSLEAMFGQDDGDAEVMDESGDGGQNFFGRGRVEGRRRLVEDQNLWVSGQDRADGDSLLLASGQLMQGAASQLGDAKEIKGLFDPFPHDFRWHG